jgi:hypothetical protein
MGNRCEYAIDNHGVIIRVCGGWDDFAAQNGGQNVLGSRVIGTKLYDYMTEAVAHLYEQLVNDARAAGKTRAIPFRCDAPDLRRFMQLTVSPGLSGEMLLESTLLRKEERPPVELLAKPFVKPNGNHERSLLRMCAWCKRVQRDNRWIEIEQALRDAAIVCTENLSVTHGICADCHQLVSR